MNDSAPGTASATSEATASEGVDARLLPGVGRAVFGGVVRGLVVVVLGVLAAAVAVAGVFVHRWQQPVGPALAVGAAVGAAVLSRHLCRSRWGLAVVAVAWFGPVLLLAQSRAAGDVLIAGDPTGFVFLLGGVVGWAITLGLGTARRRARDE